MTSVILILQFVLAVVLTITVLLQKSSSIGLGAYSGSNESVFGAKGPAGFMTKLTFALGIAFVLNTLALGYFYNEDKKGTLVDQIDTKSLVPASPIKTSPTAPVAPAEGNAPAAPAETAVPAAPIEGK